VRVTRGSLQVYPWENPRVWKLADLSHLSPQVCTDLGSCSGCCEYLPQVLMRLLLFIYYFTNLIDYYITYFGYQFLFIKIFKIHNKNTTKNKIKKGRKGGAGGRGSRSLLLLLPLTLPPFPLLPPPPPPFTLPPAPAARPCWWWWCCCRSTPSFVLVRACPAVRLGSPHSCSLALVCARCRSFMLTAAHP
jgi:hypothetical protein